MSTLSTTEVLCLCRVYCGGPKGIPEGDIRKSLATYFLQRLSPVEWNTLASESLRRLEELSLIGTKPTAITDAGRNVVQAVLKVETLPSTISWKSMQNVWLTGLALDAPLHDEKERNRFRTSDGLRGWILKEHLKLSGDGCPSLTQALASLVWKELFGIESTRRLTTAAIVEELLRRKLGGNLKLKKDQLSALLPATLVEADRPAPDALRQAVVRKWLTTRVALDDLTAPVVTLADFVKNVLEATRRCQTGRFGPHKVFISQVRREFEKLPSTHAMTVDEFHQKLCEAHQAGLIVLSRADLVEAMDSSDVADSEVRWLNATFHFVNDQRQ